MPNSEAETRERKWGVDEYAVHRLFFDRAGSGLHRHCALDAAPRSPKRGVARPATSLDHALPPRPTRRSLWSDYGGHMNWGFVIELAVILLAVLALAVFVFYALERRGRRH